MNAAAMMEHCPDAETLAAYSDGMLDAQLRLDVTRHLADCGLCQDVLIDLDAAKHELAEGSGNVVRGRWGRRVVPLAAAAAVVVVLFGVTIRERLLDRRSMPALVEAANALSERPAAARLSGEFVYKIHRTYRSGGKGDPKPAVLLAASYAAERAEKSPTAANLHAAGVGHILTEEDHRAAVAALEGAVRANPESAAILTDLAAAYIARGQTGDYERARNAADKSLAIERTPAAVWNRAVALELLDDPRARDAWQQYLALDPSSPWADEARTKHLSQLRD